MPKVRDPAADSTEQQARNTSKTTSTGATLKAVQPGEVGANHEPRDLSKLLGELTAEEQEFRLILEQLGVTYNHDKRKFYYANEPDTKFNEVTLMRRLRARVPHLVTLSTVEDYLNLLVEEEQTKEFVAIREKLSKVDREAGTAELRKFLGLVCTEGADLSEVILRHWIWVVKCKMFGREPVGQVMPVFQGTQGIGKTTIIKHFLKPLGKLTSKWEFSQITDKREWLALEKSYAGYVEELSGIKPDTLATLKKLITGDYEECRILNTMTRVVVDVNCNLIGDTNGNVADVIKDETGGRRFWEVRCRSDIDLTAVAAIDFELVWACVSYEDDPPTPSSPHFATIKALQENKIRARTPIDYWLAERGYAPGEHPHSRADLYEDFSKWCAPQREDPGTQTKLTKHLKARGFNSPTDPMRVPGEAKTVRVVHLNVPRPTRK